MRSTGSDKYKHSQTHHVGLSAKGYRGTGRDNRSVRVTKDNRKRHHNRAKQTEGLLEQILTDGNFERHIARSRKTKVQVELTACRWMNFYPT